MNVYGIILFLHLCALFGAFAASSLVHFSERRMTVAATTGEVGSWLALAEKVEKAFPIAIAILVATGAYMVHAAWAWSTGWLDVCFVGVFVLLVNGPIVIGSRHRLLKKALQEAGDGPVNDAVARLARDPVARSTSWGNTFLALGIACVMVTKPLVAGAAVVLVSAFIIGTLVAVPFRRVASPAADAVVLD